MHCQTGSKYEKARPGSPEQIKKRYEDDWYVTKIGM